MPFDKEITLIQPNADGSEATKCTHSADTPNKRAPEMEAIIAAGKPWDDKAFYDTIAWAVQGESGNMAHYKRRFRWHRLSQYDKDLKLWADDGPSPLDVMQGTLNDCWVLGVLQSLALQPDIIKRVFHNNATNTAGIYAVNMHLLGSPITIYVDDWFPFVKLNYGSRKGQTIPVFAQIPNSKAIWPMILEKAFAKYYGNYEHLDRGSPTTAFASLFGSGQAHEYYSLSQVSNGEHWNVMKNTPLPAIS